MREITATFIGHGSCPELGSDIVQREIMAMAERQRHMRLRKGRI